ncbi:MAG: hypothetical protein IJA86_02580 [Clostridia bacterium]|nr:hypothetical protein [Clostridia bacterium]
MKRQPLKKSDIQRDLLAVLNRRKVVAVYLTVFLCISILCYISFAVLFANGTDLPPGKLTFVPPVARLIIGPFIMLILTGFLLQYYYIKLYEIKNGKFDITKEKCLQKEKKLQRYYHRTENENFLYFRNGTITVKADVFSYTNAGDAFYLIWLKSSRIPLLAYHTNQYEIDAV